MLPTTIFWPLQEDVRAPGVCYGWASPTKVCVAGRFAEDVDLETARTRIRALRLDQHIQPAVLDLPDLDTCIIVQYQRYPSKSLRFYDIDNDSLAYSAGLDRSLISQLNLAHQIHSLVNGETVKLHKPTAAVLLRLAATVLRPALTLVYSLRLSFLTQLLPRSAVGKQLQTRGNQVGSLLRGIDGLSTTSLTTGIPEYAQKYTAFFNELWLILNDITLGVAFGTFLRDNAQYLASVLTPAFKTHLLDDLEAALTWLDSWPAGLKLNTELSRFYSRAFISLVHYWGGFLTRHVLDHTALLITFCGYASIFGGLSLLIALFIDILAFIVTPHITLCYRVACGVYSLEKAALGGLWALFRGKRYNALRNRMDTWDYDIDQLLFGTMLFTLLTFLSPTTMVYYFLFALARLVSLLIRASLEVCLAFMNHFPLFMLMLKVKDPSRIPDNICLLPSPDAAGNVLLLMVCGLPMFYAADWCTSAFVEST
ncbi:phosphatidylinositol N-acetylglucosaminyltransferase subunit GPI1 [Ephemerocybe angulata]|uniref:Phosphatidylinositol N-acetylglucosaminyltransferase subunit GPI1 n=1 Tax=Ephemerocybe angulata TaxID=980116 RepID=A0A8H6I0B1_9AGAR|nr:phosphatidylinositol N-acetylglucosaminyltransferase subunit GPI1 [Tulosesus angulatus]